MSQGNGKRKTTAEICEELALPVAERLGVTIWEVVFEKEGAGWYLRYLLDTEDGIDIVTCEEFSRQVSDLLDEADPIEQSYCLEVSSPGIERRLTRDWHFEQYAGSRVLVRLIRPVEGAREFIGRLERYDKGDGSVILLPEDGEPRSFAKGEVAFVRLYIEF